jgi:hypothetical protein
MNAMMFWTMLEPTSKSQIAASRMLALLFAVVVFFNRALSWNAQLAQDLFRITESVSRCQLEYHQLEVAKGKETVLADLSGPGKVTYYLKNSR